MVLLFRGSTHGWTPAQFHSLCDTNKGPSVTFIKSQAGKIFGGFTMQTWQEPACGYSRIDEKAMIFSIDNQKVYKVVNSGFAKWCASGEGPSFGGNTLRIYSNPMNKQDGCDTMTNGEGNGDRY